MPREGSGQLVVHRGIDIYIVSQERIRTLFEAHIV